ncbi:hypothetical protein GCM10011335_26560 [Aureimonas glaciei]|uniref:Lipoprotein n=1 Tax=Aureimonas glaciei TaxID=1776957 RepID=A0A916XYH1_9HYPH|nr:hypothetical protein GCM10011335_26560 [Aureimonas glaciei]
MRSTALKITLLGALLSGCATGMPAGLSLTSTGTAQTSLPPPPAPPAPEPILAAASRESAPRPTRTTPARRLPITERVKSLECTPARLENGKRYKAVCR